MRVKISFVDVVTKQIQVMEKHLKWRLPLQLSTVKLDCWQLYILSKGTRQCIMFMMCTGIRKRLYSENNNSRCI
jgi:hypothetical protein